MLKALLITAALIFPAWQAYMAQMEKADPISNGAGWVGAGLLGAVLAWLMFVHIPATYKQMAAKDTQINELLKTKDSQLVEKDRQLQAQLTEKDKQLQFILDKKWEMLQAVTRDYKEAQADMAREYKESLKEVTTHCEGEVHRMSTLWQGEMRNLTEAITDLSLKVDSINYPRQQRRLPPPT